MASTSNHLTRLGDIALDFSCSLRLEVLVMHGSKNLGGEDIVPITPTLISLELAGILGWTLVLESLPSLSIVFVRLDDRCEDYCLHNYYGDCGDQLSRGNYCMDSTMPIMMILCFSVV
uniref:Uncharacterized protein n=1 Tax=Oryza punctata TaxID=4537 RepID=A0A0E0MEG0_ORYPU